MIESDRPSGRTDWEPPRTRGLPRGGSWEPASASPVVSKRDNAALPFVESDPGLGWSPTSWRNGRTAR